MCGRRQSMIMWFVFGLFIVFGGVLSAPERAVCDTPFPARESRAAFYHAMDKVQIGWSEAQVRDILGPPDDVLPSYNSIDREYGYGTWYYGTNGHNTLATLGSVEFQAGKVEYVVGSHGDPPSSELISDAELVEAMRRMYRPPGYEKGFWSRSDSLHLVQASNLLIPKGQEKALAIIGEYTRIEADGFDEDIWLYWLVRTMFRSKLPDGVFPVPGIGLITPAPPKDRRKWPTFPVMTIDDVPFNLCRGALLMGLGEPFKEYLQKHKSEWIIRHKQLRPPDDPFPVSKKLIACSRVDPDKTLFPVPYLYDDRDALQEILTLVRTAYRPKATKPCCCCIDWADYDKYHKEFLALGCRWDEEKQMYVRKNGIVLPDPNNSFPQFECHFHDIPGLDITITLSRENNSIVNYSVSTKEQGTKTIQSAIAVFEDTGKNAELNWVSINDPASIGTLAMTRQQVLTSPPHEVQPDGHNISSCINLAKGRHMRCVILYDGKRYISPVYIL